MSCSWDAPQSHVLPLLTAKLWLFHDGVETAARDAAEHRTRPQEAGNGTSPGADTSLAGVGDEAWVTDHGALIMVVARKANVVLTMEYAPRSRGGADQSDAVADARALLDLVTVG